MHLAFLSPHPGGREMLVQPGLAGNTMARSGAALVYTTICKQARQLLIKLSSAPEKPNPSRVGGADSRSQGNAGSRESPQSGSSEAIEILGNI